MTLRIYLTGRIAIEGPRGIAGEKDLPGRQGRLALAHLALDFQPPIPKDKLADAIWGSSLPLSWEAAVNSIISKIRRTFSGVGLPGREILSQGLGCYQLRFPAGTVLDLEVALNSIDQAEGALRAGDPQAAWSDATISASIARRPFLPGEDAQWVVSERAKLQTALMRALECLVQIWSWKGDMVLAARVAEELVKLEPFREISHQYLMRAHLAAGNRAQAVRAYERCRQLLADELGVDPSPETQAVYLEALKS